MAIVPKRILVTGGNRGIGLSIIQSLAIHPQTTDSVILMGCRDTSKGAEAISELGKADSSIHTSNILPIELDVCSNSSIAAAVDLVKSKYGHLDILVNNAGIAWAAKKEDHSDVRPSFSNILDVNVTSVYMVTTLFAPLLRKAPTGNPKVINISSGRASLTRSSTGKLPPTLVIAYCVSKTALSGLTVELSKVEDNQGIEFQLANPGHCKTAFNGYRGARDPLEGATVVVELVVGERRPLRIWETKGADRALQEVPW